MTKRFKFRHDNTLYHPTDDNKVIQLMVLEERPSGVLYLGRKRNFTGFHFWAKGYCVSTVGLDEQTIRSYIKAQEEREKREEQLSLLDPKGPSKDE